MALQDTELWNRQTWRLEKEALISKPVYNTRIGLDLRAFSLHPFGLQECKVPFWTPLINPELGFKDQEHERAFGVFYFPSNMYLYFASKNGK